MRTNKKSIAFCNSININDKYNKVYHFTNENVGCLKKIYDFENSNVLTVVGSGDQYFTSILNGAKNVDVFDINKTSYLYLLLKFYAIRELSYEEFYDSFILKRFNSINIYTKLERVLPIEVLKYYRYLVENYKNSFTSDGINFSSKKNIRYYLKSGNSIIPYLNINKYYKLKSILKYTEVPNFINNNILNLKNEVRGKYDIILMSNVFDYLGMNLDDYTKLLKYLDCPRVQACYDWYGIYLSQFASSGYKFDIVEPSSPSQYFERENYVYTLKK